MEEQGKQKRLTSGEISQLWSQYLNDTASICMLTYFQEKAEDVEIKPIIEHSLQLSKAHIQKITAILNEEKNTVPHGFTTEEDVDLTSPRLYSDSYVLNFIHQMAVIGLTSYSTSLSLSARSDITTYYKECLNETIQLFEMTKDLLLSKGLYIRSPYFPSLEHVDFIKKQSFIFDFFGEKRPLIALEAANLYANIQRNALGSATLVGFSQVAKSKDVTQFLLRGIDIAKKHIKLFANKLEDSDLPVPISWNADVTKSTTYTFSEKLMMFYTFSLITLSVGYYGIGVAASPRIDIGILYNRLSLEIQKYAEDGANIMIKNGWLEQPPLAPDRRKLAKQNMQN
ncbi:DUF3231 family protein [Metabacillus arenae]|uniref:DUF3231 family protein n=1 Tax=Metabacillus arenae TaxID=2771434 RepID=A0A926S3M8_9BACI|nr:DUF3231 family protein [Metabacillus arenae]MBD1383119.1 DUF3231 family protein [Metabacillus arenae]